MNTTLHNRIMRRVYMAYATRLATHAITMQIGLFVLALVVFAKLVFVQRVLENLASIDIAQVPSFLLSAFLHSEVLTMIAVGTMVFILLSVPLQIKGKFIPRLQMA